MKESSKEPASLYESLVTAGVRETYAKAMYGYVMQARRDEARQLAKKGGAAKTPVGGNTTQELIDIGVRWDRLGLPVDGTNVMITGKAMAMITANGYKNKVLQLYPGTVWDQQLVRKGDVFTISKQDGKISYSHVISDPFGSQPIVGAYVLIKNKRGEFFESLNPEDYQKMRGQSKQMALWDKWSSEFWNKSVVKRACKRHFNDDFEEIEAYDNQHYGIDENAKPQQEPDEMVEMAVKQLESQTDVGELKRVFMSLGELMKLPEIVAAKDRAKVAIAKATAAQQKGKKNASVPVPSTSSTDTA